MFQFKQFTIHQDLCAMKVGTDSVLLGAWTRLKDGNVLDIGSGTGLISLMLAQRNLNCIIDAIDIDDGAFAQTSQNVIASHWKDRINTHHTSLQNFKSKQQYDLIVTNPPYFIDSTKTQDASRNTARHTDSLPFEIIISSVKRLLKTNGVFAIVLPPTEALLFIEKASSNQLYLTRSCHVKPNSTKAVKRVLMEFSYSTSRKDLELQKTILKEENITIETGIRHQYTSEYMELTKDFYLKF